MPKNVIIVGAYGKMGTVTCDTIEKSPEFELCAKIGRGDSLEQSIKDNPVDIVIDFTDADSVYANAQLIIANNIHPVIGSTGLLEQHITHLQSLCQEKQLGGIIAPNFSLGAILLMKLSAVAARFYHDVEIIETHHQHKKDAPSGTAIKTADMIAAHLKGDKQACATEELIPGARGGVYKGINIHSQRLPGTIANQQVTFGGQGETLCINHQTINRECFMPGVLLACNAVTQLDAMIYGLEQLID